MSFRKGKPEVRKKQKETICSYLREEREGRRVVDPPPGAEYIQISPLGVIPSHTNKENGD